MFYWQGISKLAIAMIPLAKQRNHAVNCTILQKKKVSQKGRLSNASNCADAALELMTGFEPVTYALPRRCATACATSATLAIIAHSGTLVKPFFQKNKIFFRRVGFCVVSLDFWLCLGYNNMDNAVIC